MKKHVQATKVTCRGGVALAIRELISVAEIMVVTARGSLWVRSGCRRCCWKRSRHRSSSTSTTGSRGSGRGSKRMNIDRRLSSNRGRRSHHGTKQHLDFCRCSTSANPATAAAFPTTPETIQSCHASADISVHGLCCEKFALTN